MDALTPEQMQQIQRMINEGLISPSGRSPIRDRQLHDLRLVPTATDPRPLFVPSAEAPRDAKPYVYTKWPSLRWHKETGEERLVSNARESDALGADWGEEPHHMKPADPLAGVQEALAVLTESERDAIMNNQQDLRTKRLVDQVSTLSHADLETVMVAMKSRAKATKKTA